MTLQLELEKWIQEHRFPKDGNKRPEHQSFVIREADLRALLEGKVLCHAEPVAYRHERDGTEGIPENEIDVRLSFHASSDVVWGMPGRDYCEAFPATVVPLYKAAGGGVG